MYAQVLAVHSSPVHAFSKQSAASITLVAGWGVEGDAHSGTTIKHRSRVARDPQQPNLRQVHLIHVELLTQLSAAGFPVGPGSLGENITTQDLDLLSLSQGTELHIGPEAVIIVTGLRNPCRQLEAFTPGLMHAVLDRTLDGKLIRKAGVMGIVQAGGVVSPGDRIRVVVPSTATQALEPV